MPTAQRRIRRPRDSPRLARELFVCQYLCGHSYLSELDDDLDVVRLPGESPRELVRLFTAADKLREPRDVGARQRLPPYTSAACWR